MIDTQPITAAVPRPAGGEPGGEGHSEELEHGGFSTVLDRRLGWLRYGRLAALQALNGAPFMRQGFAGIGSPVPGMGPAGVALVPVPVTTVNFNFFGLPPEGGPAGEAGDLAGLLETLDVSALAGPEGPASPFLGDPETVLPALQNAGLEVPRDPGELAEKLAQRIAALGRNGDTRIEMDVDHAVYGPIGVQVEVSGREVRLSFASADAGLREALQAAGDGLSRHLEARGLKLADLDIQPLKGTGPGGPVQPAATLYKALADAAAPLSLINGLG